ncbi:MAG: NAD(P)-dependent oxidoreductase [Opitutae bacterium]|nr:NAD(P)-dependent oxidoreductase [Opitutae bacterium]MBT5380148.1 NAD(P)-dependent oxidoreductase [Opitutae bacterium]MBT5691671.1 NAD(P)-dependent oxidoreductase [Opitutae bacterium]MBT6957005.1 NAD(P)-dependent oxidoreductase [Opitutae bacterium]MBT7854535.1 NAD(P)-dependent oxidoreductase [Opitutae bacterium]
MNLKEFKIGFVGLGRMGANMARHLKDQGYTLGPVYDIIPDVASSLASELDATAVQKLSEVTTGSDIVITVVTDDTAMRSIFFDDDNLFQNSSGKIFLNCATLSPDIHIELERVAAANDAETLEVCMASSIPQAREGKLYLMIAGQEETFNKVKSLLDDMSVNLRFVGPAGKAAQVKALVNMVMNINTAALAEGLGLGDALGIDLTLLQEVFSQTGANSRVLETDGEDMVVRDHECYFSCDHAAKDSGIAIDVAESVGINLPLAKATFAQFERMKQIGLGHYDKSGVAELTFKGRHA